MTADRSEHGFTVIELMITLAITTIASVILLNFLVSTTNVTASTDRDTRAERDAQLALRTITQDVRSANPILGSCGAGYASCLSFTVPRPSTANPSCSSTITYRRSGNDVLRDRTDQNCATNRSAAGVRVITVADATPLFSYTDGLDRTIGLTQVCSADLSQPRCVPQAKTVRINFALTYPGQKTSPLRFAASVTLRNNR